MDDRLVGLALRRVRLRLDQRQADVAASSGMSTSTYSAIERGHIVSLPRLRAAAATLEVRIDLVARWRGGDLDRLVRGRHSAMSEQVASMLIDQGWTVLPEVSFNRYGERGVIDLVGWHAGTRAVLIVELKTELVDIGEVLATSDRRRRLIGHIASERGWQPKHVGTWLVIAESRTNRRHVAMHQALLRAAFPEDGRATRGWLAKPNRPQAGLWFLTNSSTARVGRGQAPIKRVSRGRRNKSAPESG
jgi:transcriptional regulator with XRE-family HTH domain